MHLLLVALALSAPVRSAAIDLHLHLRMDASLPGIFRGHPTEEPVRVSSRKARFSNQVSLKDLEAANVRLVMASLYAPAVISQLRGGYVKALHAQIDAVESWVKEHHRSVLVRTPDEAEAVLKSKDWKLGVILAAEGGHGFDTLEDLDRFFERGVRMVTITHFEDNAWGGTADVKYWPVSDCAPGGNDSGKRNPKGLSEQGAKLVDQAVARGLILDLTHSGDKTVKDIAARHPGLPLMFSHVGARELTPCERMISPELLAEVKRSRGIVGIPFAANYLDQDVESLLRHAKLLAAGAGKETVALGTDYNGFITRIEGAAGSEGYSFVLKRLEEAGIPASSSAEYFLQFWRRTAAYGLPKTAR